MKATEPGPIVGYALDHYDGNGVGTILVMVDLGWFGGSDTLEAENAELRAQLQEFGSRLDRLEALLDGDARRVRETKRGP